jgi:hypothetical protein
MAAAINGANIEHSGSTRRSAWCHGKRDGALCPKLAEGIARQHVADC